MWLYLIKLCGGGPEIKFIPYKANNDINEINTIKRGVHINLIFIPKKDIIANNNNKEPRSISRRKDSRSFTESRFFYINWNKDS